MSTKKFSTPEAGDSFRGSKKNRGETSEEILQEWEGAVETVEEKSFTAKLWDITANEPYPTETVEIPIEDVSKNDRELIRPGAAFNLAVVHSACPDSTGETFGRVTFIRHVRTAEDMARVERKAQSLIEFLGLES